MRSIGLVVHFGRPAAVAAAEVVRDWAAGNGVNVIDVDAWGDEPGPGVGRIPPAPPRDGAGADLIVTIGGDGTFLRGARAAVAARCPVLGVNVGRVGFLTEVEAADIPAALDSCCQGRAEIEERMTLALRSSRPLRVPPDVRALASHHGGPATLPQDRPDAPGGQGWAGATDLTAINDVVLEKLVRDRQVSLGVYLDGRLFASYSADAVIVASPTGSTAYSFSAGGPVLSPRLRALVFTPVAPHMVFNRSLVLAGDEPIAVRVLDQSGPVALSVDGQLRGVLEPGDWVAVHAGGSTVRLVRVHPSDFYGRLRHRFALSDAPALATGGHLPAEYRPREPVPPEIARLFRLR